MEKAELPDVKMGDWQVEKFIIDRLDFSNATLGRAAPLGETFTKLTYKGMVIMSDVPAEQRDHYTPVYMATGSCLINGLGLGMVLKNVLLKPDVTDVTVVERSMEVLAMVGPHYTDPRVTLVHDCAFAYKPPKDKKYNMVWHDIWNNICTDNLPEMHKLHRKYGSKADWQGSWSRSIVERIVREEKKRKKLWGWGYR